MNKTLIATIVSLFAVSGAYAAASNEGAVTVSTDPAKAAAVERHAKELQARDEKVADKPVTHASKKANKPHKHHASHKAAAKNAGQLNGSVRP